MRQRVFGFQNGVVRCLAISGLALLIGCGLASYYFHVYGESDEEEQDESVTSQAHAVAPLRDNSGVRIVFGQE